MIRQAYSTPEKFSRMSIIELRGYCLLYGRALSREGDTKFSGRLVNALSEDSAGARFTAQCRPANGTEPVHISLQSQVDSAEATDAIRKAATRLALQNNDMNYMPPPGLKCGYAETSTYYYDPRTGWMNHYRLSITKGTATPGHQTLVKETYAMEAEQ